MRRRGVQNFNYAFVFYDVNEKRVAKVFKICKKYLEHYQKSVFRGKTSPSQLLHLKRELKEIIVDGEDFICIIKMINDSIFSEEVMGLVDKSFEDFI